MRVGRDPPFFKLNGSRMKNKKIPMENLGFLKGSPFIVTFKYLPEGVRGFCGSRVYIYELNKSLPWHHEIYTNYLHKIRPGLLNFPFSTHLCTPGIAYGRQFIRLHKVFYQANNSNLLVDSWGSVAASILQKHTRFVLYLNLELREILSKLSSTSFAGVAFARKIQGESSWYFPLKLLRRLPNKYMKELGELESVFRAT